METRDEGLTIQQFASLSGLSADTLRYYERIGLIDRVQRAGSGHRRYSEDDRHWVEFLNKLRATGMSIRAMQTYAGLQRQGDATLARRVELLEELRDQVVARVAELQESLELIRFKIRVYGRELKQLRAAAARGEPDAARAPVPCRVPGVPTGARGARAWTPRSASRLVTSRPRQGERP